MPDKAGSWRSSFPREESINLTRTSIRPCSMFNADRLMDAWMHRWMCNIHSTPENVVSPDEDGSLLSFGIKVIASQSSYHFNQFQNPPCRLILFQILPMTVKRRWKLILMLLFLRLPRRLSLYTLPQYWHSFPTMINLCCNDCGTFTVFVVFSCSPCCSENIHKHI